MFFHHILDAEWLFGNVQRSLVEFHTGGSCLSHRTDQDYLSFGLIHTVLADGEDSHIAFGTTLALPTMTDSGSE